MRSILGALVLTAVVPQVQCRRRMLPISFISEMRRGMRNSLNRLLPDQAYI